MDDIDRTLYLELDLILWDRVERFVEDNIAFHMYEVRWRFISVGTLTDEYGNGVMMRAE